MERSVDASEPASPSMTLRIRSIELRCPQCGGELDAKQEQEITCRSCRRRYPIIEGQPCMIAPDNPLFGGRDPTFTERIGFSGRRTRALGRWIPSPTAGRGWREVRKLLQARFRGSGSVLIIGSGENQKIAGDCRSLFSETLVSDVVFDRDADLMCDGAALPFPDRTVDCVVLIAVLEHVLDPARVVGEVFRILTDDGVVAADTPFMQQVHMGAFDFCRFSDLGHRWLFRDFTEIGRGVSSGPASALVWSLEYFVSSFAPGRASGRFMKALARFAFFWIKYLDLFLIGRPAAVDAACGVYFVGGKSRSHRTVTPAELVSSYRGRQ